MTQAWRWDQQLAITAGAYAEYDDGSGGRSLQEDEEDLSLIICEIPTEGCKNGMYNVKKCACEVGCGCSYSFLEWTACQLQVTHNSSRFREHGLPTSHRMACSIGGLSPARELKMRRQLSATCVS